MKKSTESASFASWTAATDPPPAACSHESVGVDDLAGMRHGLDRDELAASVLHFGEKTVSDVAVPRADIIAVPATISFEGLVAAFAEAGHSRLPVYEDSLDTVIGMIHVKDVFAVQVTGAEPPPDIRELIRIPLYVPESMGVLDLLARMRAGASTSPSSSTSSAAPRAC